MIAPQLHRATLALGAAAVTSSLFAFASGLDQSINLIHVRGASIAAIIVLGIVAIVAGARQLPIMGLIAGAGFAACALLQLIQLGQPLNLLGGDGSTVSLMGALGIGLMSIWLVGRASERVSKGPR